MSYTAFDASAIERLATSDDLPTRLTAALRGTRESWTGRRMSPELAYGRHAGPPPWTARSAAVLLLLCQRYGRWHVPLTVRPATLTRHAGQISLPGGLVEPGESSDGAALRELAEELGIERPVELIGQLPTCYVFASDCTVTPWIAAARFEPEWRPDAREVERVVELPLALLFDPASVGQMTIQRGPFEFMAPCFRIGDDQVWGATSVLLGGLADVLSVVGRTANEGDAPDE